MIPKTREEAIEALRACAAQSSDRFDLTACALACAIHEDPKRDVSQARATLEDISTLAIGHQPKTALDFATLMFGELAFSGSKQDYDDPANADLISILSRRQGLPVGLGVVWRHAAKAVAAPLFGTDTPGHFLLRLEGEAGPTFIDPFEGGAIWSEVEFAAMAKAARLPAITEAMRRPVSDRIIAIRLQTNLVMRARTSGDIEAWERAAYRRLILLNDNWRVALDYSEAAEAAGMMKVAIEWAERAYAMAGAPAPDVRIQTLRSRLN